jgi:polar amino acid transport system substrate-binding protein
VKGSSSVDFLHHHRIGHRAFANPQAGLESLQAGGIDAFVYDRPLLSWTVRQNFPRLQVLRVTFEPQNYAIALPPHSALRIPINVALLDNVASDWWQDALYRYFGAASSSEEKE